MELQEEEPEQLLYTCVTCSKVFMDECLLQLHQMEQHDYQCSLQLQDRVASNSDLLRISSGSLTFAARDDEFILGFGLVQEDELEIRHDGARQQQAGLEEPPSNVMEDQMRNKRMERIHSEIIKSQVVIRLRDVCDRAKPNGERKVGSLNGGAATKTSGAAAATIEKSGARPKFTCIHCGKVFVVESQCRSHERSAHVTDTPPVEPQCVRQDRLAPGAQVVDAIVPPLDAISKDPEDWQGAMVKIAPEVMQVPSNEAERQQGTAQLLQETKCPPPASVDRSPSVQDGVELECPENGKCSVEERSDSTDSVKENIIKKSPSNGVKENFMHAAQNGAAQKYVCHDCGSCFGWRSGLRRHFERCTISKPYECNAFGCRTRFGSRRELRRHGLVHVNVNVNVEDHGGPLDENSLSTSGVLALETSPDQSQEYPKNQKSPSQPENLLENYVQDPNTDKFVLLDPMGESSLTFLESITRPPAQKEVHGGEQTVVAVAFGSTVQPSIMDDSGAKKTGKTTTDDEFQYYRDEDQRYVDPPETRTHETCKVCGACVGFADLRPHIQSHLIKGQRDCNICSYKAFNAKYLLDHLNIHYGLKPYECGVCKRRFTFSTYLRSHTRQVHGEGGKQHQCRFCDEKFVRPCHRRTHERSHKAPKGTVSNADAGAQETSPQSSTFTPLENHHPPPDSAIVNGDSLHQLRASTTLQYPPPGFCQQAVDMPPPAYQHHGQAPVTQQPNNWANWAWADQQRQAALNYPTLNVGYHENGPAPPIPTPYSAQNNHGNHIPPQSQYGNIYPCEPQMQLPPVPPPQTYPPPDFGFQAPDRYSISMATATPAYDLWADLRDEEMRLFADNAFHDPFSSSSSVNYLRSDSDPMMGSSSIYHSKSSSYPDGGGFGVDPFMNITTADMQNQSQSYSQGYSGGGRLRQDSKQSQSQGSRVKIKIRWDKGTPIIVGSAAVAGKTASAGIRRRLYPSSTSQTHDLICRSCPHPRRRPFSSRFTLQRHQKRVHGGASQCQVAVNSNPPRYIPTHHSLNIIKEESTAKEELLEDLNLRREDVPILSRRCSVSLQDIGDKTRPCPVCKENVRIRDTLTHKSGHRETCHICGKSVLASEIISHGSTHVSSLHCEMCGWKGKQKSQIWEHMNGHLGVKPLKCDYCGVGFASRSSARIHTIARHTNIRLHKCGFCEARFVTPQVKRMHELQHYTTNCPHCNEYFERKRELAVHIRRHYRKEGQKLVLDSREAPHELGENGPQHQTPTAGSNNETD